MFARTAFAAFLVLLFLGPAAMSEDAKRVPEDAAVRGDARDTDKHNMEVGRYYMSKRILTGAINRFKVVVTRFPSSPFVDEALFRIADAYLQLGIAQEAQAAAAVLDRKFPDSHWRSDARDRLKALGFEPAENQKSWIGRAFPITESAPP